MMPLKASTRAFAPRHAGVRSRFNKLTMKQQLRAREESTGPNIPLIPKCPYPTCTCADTPTDLDIETSKDLYGTMAAYNDQIVVSTGQTDWKSRIEDEKDSAPWGSLVARMKQLLGRKGPLHDPYQNVMVTASSFAGPEESSSEKQQALLFPSFLFVDGIDPSEAGTLAFLEAFLALQASSSEPNAARTDESKKMWDLGTVHPISAPTILVCSHNSRDTRCGVLGPLLHAEFVQYIKKRHTLRNKVVSEQIASEGRNQPEPQFFACHPVFQADALVGHEMNHHAINVGMISHVGGHNRAGNVIVYIPPEYQILAVKNQPYGSQPKDEVATEISQPVHKGEPLSPETAELNLSPLAGKGIWYGRVEPKHVEGIVEQTISQGIVIRELFRGGIHQNGQIIRI